MPSGKHQKHNSPEGGLASVALFDPARRWRVKWDMPKKQIPRDERDDHRLVPCRKGRRGHLYVHGPTLIGFTGTGLKLRRALLALGCKAWQTGDEEFSVVFPPESLDQVAKLVRPLFKNVKKGSVLGGNDGLAAAIGADTTSAMNSEPAR
jgi:hypothetical protein